MNAEQQWQKLKKNYLKQVEDALASINHPKRSTILQDVNEHLDRKFAELPVDKLNWEGYQQILIDMGPPAAYAELLSPETFAAKKRFRVFESLMIVLVVILAAAGSYLIYTLQKKSCKTPAPVTQSFDFELDERVLGTWATVDFVKSIDDFNPTRKSWQGELFLKELAFEDNAVSWWTNKNGGPYKHEWTKGKVDPLNERPAFYYLRNIDGQIYLFYEWVSGDVTLRGREPSYYVLKQTVGGKPAMPSWFENDPQAIGYWVSVDFIENIEDFQSEEQRTDDLFIKTLDFKDNGTLYWTIGDSQPIGLNWTRGTIRPSGIWPAPYVIKQFDKADYLFYEYRTRDRHPAGYYVFKRASRPDATEEIKDEFFENDSHVLGQRTTVDFVHTPDNFQPGQQSWKGKLWVKKLHFQKQGIVEWCLGEDQMKAIHRWTKGKLLDDELPARYIIEKYEDGDYLFMEWNSGDVTIRGQKPAYYVLKKVE